MGISDVSQIWLICLVKMVFNVLINCPNGLLLCDRLVVVELPVVVVRSSGVVGVVGLATVAGLPMVVVQFSG